MRVELASDRREAELAGVERLASSWKLIPWPLIFPEFGPNFFTVSANFTETIVASWYPNRKV